MEPVKPWKMVILWFSWDWMGISWWFAIVMIYPFYPFLNIKKMWKTPGFPRKMIYKWWVFHIIPRLRKRLQEGIQWPMENTLWLAAREFAVNDVWIRSPHYPKVSKVCSNRARMKKLNTKPGFLGDVISHQGEGSW
jgi:hypothetical protein